MGDVVTSKLQLDPISRPPMPRDLAQSWTELAFVHALAAHTGDTFERVATLFMSTSPNARALVESPQGWAALSACLIERKSDIPPLVPRIH